MKKDINKMILGTEITAALKIGQVIPGARLEQGKRLVIQ